MITLINAQLIWAQKPLSQVPLIKIYEEEASDESFLKDIRDRSNSVLAVTYGPLASPSLAVACGASAWNSYTVPVLCRERLWVVMDLKRRYRNRTNEWMNSLFGGTGRFSWSWILTWLEWSPCSVGRATLSGACSMTGFNGGRGGPVSTGTTVAGMAGATASKDRSIAESSSITTGGRLQSGGSTGKKFLF